MDVLLREDPAPHVALLRIHRPEARNALNAQVRARLGEEFARIAADPAIRCVVLGGDEKAFAAGADIKEQAAREFHAALAAQPLRPVAQCTRPVIAAVNGFALGGGCELAMQCDIVIASENARFGQPEVNLGLVPGAGGTQRLPRLVGKSNALYMLLTGAIVDAHNAFRMGLVSELTPSDALPRALAVASLIASKPPTAVRQIKEVVHAGADVSLETALALEWRAYQLMFGTSDAREGMHAFMEKRQPNYVGR